MAASPSYYIDYTVIFLVSKTKTTHTAHKKIFEVKFIFLRNQLFTLSLFFYIHLSTMKVKTAFALLVATMAIDSRFDVVASSLLSSSSSILDGSDPQATRKVRPVMIM